MRLLFVLLLSAVASNAASLKQATRRDVTNRQGLLRRLSPRASITPCPGSQPRDVDGNCCTSGVLDTKKACCAAASANTVSSTCCSGDKPIYTSADGMCCPTDKAYTDCSDTKHCCTSGSLYQDGSRKRCCDSTAGDVVRLTSTSPNQACCPKNRQYTLNGETFCCAGGTVLTNGTCCAGNATPYDNNSRCCPFGSSLGGQQQRICCPNGQTATGAVGEEACCNVDRVYGVNQCCPATSNIFRSSSTGGIGCCASEVVNGECCAEGESCSPPPERKRSRRQVLHLNPLAKDHQIPKRTVDPGHYRMLNAEQTAQYLLSEGRFEHEGTTHEDQYARRISEVAWKRALVHGANVMMPYVAHFVPHVMSTFPAKLNSGQPLQLSPLYGFHPDDIPEIWARVAATDYEHIQHNGLRFSRSMIDELAGLHPGFNASLVSVYKK